MKTLLLSLLLFVPAGAYPVRIPIEGLTERNAGDLKTRVENHFTQLKKPHREWRVEMAEAKEGVLTLWAACMAGFTLEEVTGALKDSPFGVKTDDWELVGKVTLRWKATPDATPVAVEKALEKLGNVDAHVAADTITVRVVFGDKKSKTWKEVTGALSGFKTENLAMGWDNESVNGESVRMECGARRIKRDK